MGVGLGLLTGSGLRLLAPRVQQQEIALPSWLADQALITTLLGDAVEPPSDENIPNKKAAPAVAKRACFRTFATTGAGFFPAAFSVLGGSTASPSSVVISA